MHPDPKRTRFEAVALPFLKALYGTALRLAGDPDDAADVVQESLLRAYRTFDNFRTGTNCKAWLFTILYSVHINRSHKARRERGNVSVDDLEGRFERYLATPASAEAELGTVEAWGTRWQPEVENALRLLPETFRAPVLLVDVEGLSYDEAAGALGCPVGTVRSRLYRARRLLFAALHDFARETGRLAEPEAE
jgi:RNA polymerase sigma-70 factor (ECF subfamily)